MIFNLNCSKACVTIRAKNSSPTLWPESLWESLRSLLPSHSVSLRALLPKKVLSLLSSADSSYRHWAVQIGGPTGAFIVIVFGIIQGYGLEGLAIATAMAGALLVLMGLFRLGGIIKFIPYPIVVGFTSGIALTIFTTQIKDLLGLTIDKLPADCLSQWAVYFQHLNSINPISLLIGVGSILIIAVMPKIFRKIPGSLVAIIVMTAVAYLLKEVGGISGIETIGDRFNISNEIPEPQPLHINMETINQLLSPAFTIAILCAIESLLSATVADGAISEHHNSNTELIGQGVANIVVPFFGGIPVTGAIARTMTNINNGGRTPVAGIIHALVLLAIFLLLMPLIELVPMACLAGVLVIVAYNMSGWRTVRSLLRNPKSDIAILATTFILTVVFNLTIAIEIGMLLAVLLFLRRVSENVQVSVLRDELDVAQGTEMTQHETLNIAKGVEVYEINGPFFFGVATKFDEVMREMGDKPVVRIIRMRKVPFIDSTGLHNLQILVESSHREGIRVILSGVNPSVQETLRKSGLNQIVGNENICDHISKAVEKANAFVELNEKLKQ